MDNFTISDLLKKNLIQSEKPTCDFIKENLLSDDPVRLQKIVIQHPVKYSFYAGMYAMSKTKTLQAEYKLDDYFNQKVLETRKLLEFKKLKFTESSLKQMVQNNLEYKKIREEYLNALESENILSAMVKSLDHKKDMIWNLSSNLRKELDALGIVNKNK